MVQTCPWVAWITQTRSCTLKKAALLPMKMPKTSYTRVGSHTNLCRCPSSIHEFYSPFFLKHCWKSNSFFSVEVRFHGEMSGSPVQQNSGNLPLLRKVPLFCRASKEESTPRFWKTHQTPNEQQTGQAHKAAHGTSSPFAWLAHISTALLLMKSWREGFCAVMLSTQRFCICPESGLHHQ